MGLRKGRTAGNQNNQNITNNQVSQYHQDFTNNQNNQWLANNQNDQNVMNNGLVISNYSNYSNFENNYPVCRSLSNTGN